MVDLAAGATLAAKWIADGAIVEINTGATTGPVPADPKAGDPLERTMFPG